MIQLYIIVEGLTEETFVRDVLSQPLLERGVWADPILAHTNCKAQPSKGGWCSYKAVEKQIASLISQQHRRVGVRFTTMLDLYRLPEDFPGYGSNPPSEYEGSRVSWLEEQFGKEINNPRFIPHLQLHEFEALLFADIRKLSHFYPDKQKEIEELANSCNQEPESINDGPNTAPSKRILAKIPRCDKVVGGTLTAMKIGLDRLRCKCPHFNEWFTKLESLGVDESL
jgi:hypothetical protein